MIGKMHLNAQIAKKGLRLGVLTSMSAFLFVPMASADVLEFKNGTVKSHLAVDYRNRPAEDEAGITLQSIVITEWVQPSEDIAALIEFAASEHQVDALLITSIMAQESNFDPNAVSSKGAMGLMQLMPDTAVMLGVTDPFDPAQNIEGGVRYFKSLMGRYNGDRSYALAAYNAGTRAVDSYGGVPPYSETRDYIIRINNRYNATKPAPVEVVPPKPVPSQLVYGGGERVVDTLITPALAPEIEAVPAAVPLPEKVNSESEIIETEIPAAQSATEAVPIEYDIEIFADRVPDAAKTMVVTK